MDLQLKGKRALVTGASKGIGKAVAESLAQEGCDLVLVARNASALSGLADNLRSRFQVSVSTLPGDMGLPEDQAKISAQASDIEIYAEEILRMRDWLENTLAFHSGQTPQKVREDIERDRFLSALEAKEYGLVDDVLESRKGAAMVEGIK